MKVTLAVYLKKFYTDDQYCCNQKYVLKSSGKKKTEGYYIRYLEAVVLRGHTTVSALFY